MSNNLLHLSRACMTRQVDGAERGGVAEFFGDGEEGAVICFDDVVFVVPVVAVG